MRIIYEQDNGVVAIIIPTPKALETMSIHDIARKDVPLGKPFWIVDADKIPTDRTYREAWVLPSDIGVPDGAGGMYV